MKEFTPELDILQYLEVGGGAKYDYLKLMGTSLGYNFEEFTQYSFTVSVPFRDCIDLRIDSRFLREKSLEVSQLVSFPLIWVNLD